MLKYGGRGRWGLPDLLLAVRANISRASREASDRPVTPRLTPHRADTIGAIMPDYVVAKDAQPGTVQDTTEILITPGTSTVVITFMDANGVVQTVTLSNATAVNLNPTWVVPNTDPGFAAAPAMGSAAVRLWINQATDTLTYNVTYDSNSQKTATSPLS